MPVVHYRSSTKQQQQDYNQLSELLASSRLELEQSVFQTRLAEEKAASTEEHLVVRYISIYVENQFNTISQYLHQNMGNFTRFCHSDDSGIWNIVTSIQSLLVMLWYCIFL